MSGPPEPGDTAATAKGFAGLPRIGIDALKEATAAVLGVADASPYVPGESSHAATAPTAIRLASRGFAGSLGQFDFDLGATLLPEKGAFRGLADCGDVFTDPADGAGNRARITAAVRKVLEAGAAPIVLGGDDSVPIPTIAAFEGHGPISVVQVDAHVDWADVIRDNPYGYGSPMRRASEYPHVTHMVQLGIRGLGSGESWQHDDARAWGSRIFTSYDIHRDGLEEALAHVPDDRPCFVSIDCDGIDPAVFPAVNMPTPGGLNYEEIIRMLRGIAGRTRIAGLALVEYVPERDDRWRICGTIAARIATVTMGLVAEGRRIGWQKVLTPPQRALPSP